MAVATLSKYGETKNLNFLESADMTGPIAMCLTLGCLLMLVIIFLIIQNNNNFLERKNTIWLY